MSALKEALNNCIWKEHKIGDVYIMDAEYGWKIAYYPIFEDGKTKAEYELPRALVEKQIGKGIGFVNGGIDFREVPLMYLTKNKN